MTEEQAAKAREAISPLIKEAMGDFRVWDVLCDCLSEHDDETRRQGAQNFAALAEDWICEGRIDLLASAVRRMDNVRKRRMKGELTAKDSEEEAEEFLQSFGIEEEVRPENHWNAIPIVGTKEKELAVLLYIDACLEFHRLLPSKALISAWCSKVAERTIRLVCEKVSAITGWEMDERDKWVWPSGNAS